EYSLHRLPQQQCANEHESDRVEHIGRAQQVPRDSVRQDERQIEENERHLVGEIVHAVHDEAQTVGLESGDRFVNENRGVERGGCRKRPAIMGHGETSNTKPLQCSTFFTSRARLREAWYELISLHSRRSRYS